MRLTWAAVNIHQRLIIACLFSLFPVTAQSAAPASTDRIIVKWRNAESPAEPASPTRVRSLARRMGRNLNQGRNIGGSMSVLQLDHSSAATSLACSTE